MDRRPCPAKVDCDEAISIRQTACNLIAQGVAFFAGKSFRIDRQYFSTPACRLHACVTPGDRRCHAPLSHIAVWQARRACMATGEHMSAFLSAMAFAMSVLAQVAAVVGRKETEGELQAFGSVMNEPLQPLVRHSGG